MPIFSFQEQKGRPAHQRNNALLNVALNGNGAAADLMDLLRLTLGDKRAERMVRDTVCRFRVHGWFLVLLEGNRGPF